MRLGEDAYKVFVEAQASPRAEYAMSRAGPVYSHLGYCRSG
jgi:hypothetical protein